MITRKWQNSGVESRGPQACEEPVDLSVEDGDPEIVVEGSSGTATDEDSNYDTYTSSTYDPVYKVEQSVPNDNILPTTVMNLTPSVCEYDEAEGQATRLADGTGVLIVKNRYHAKRTELSMDRVTGGTRYDYTGGVAGSVLKHIEDSVSAAQSGIDAENGVPVYDSSDCETDTYVRNPSCWLTGIGGLTGLAVRTDTFSPTSWRRHHPGCTAISANHVIACRHYSFPAGGKAYWVDADNNVVSRTVTHWEELTSDEGEYLDLKVGILDSALPASIEPVEVLPDDYADYLPAHTTAGTPAARNVPLVSVIAYQSVIGGPGVQDRSAWQMLMNEWRESSGGDGPSRTYDSDDEYLRATNGPGDGDSGQAICTIINDHLVMLGLWRASTYGPGIAQYADEIEAAMTSLSGSSQTLTRADLSGYTTYGV